MFGTQIRKQMRFILSMGLIALRQRQYQKGGIENLMKGLEFQNA